MHGRGFRNSERADTRSPGKLGCFRPVQLLSTKYLNWLWQKDHIQTRASTKQRELNGTGNVLFLKLMVDT